MIYSFIALTIAITFTVPIQAQGPISFGRFGLYEAYQKPQEATELGATYTSVTLQWNLIQPNSADDWVEGQLPNLHIHTEIANNRQVVAILQGTPAWAAAENSGPQAVPDMVAWGNFTERIVQTYRGQIKHWIIWHEPDIDDASHPSYTWAGSPQDYAQLLKTAYLRIKQIDPEAQVLIAGLTYHWHDRQGQEAYLSQLLKAIAADPEAANHRFYFDTVVYHLYTYPRDMLNILTKSRSLLEAYGLGNTPIWVNEFNIPPDTFTLSDEEHAAYLVQSFALLAAGGAERFQFAALTDTADGSLGLFTQNNVRRPAYNAYRAAATTLPNYIAFSWFQEGGIYVVTLDQRIKTTTIIWNTASFEQAYNLDAIGQTARLVDPMDGDREILAQNGIYTIQLPAANCGTDWCPIGGKPQILVEAGTADQRQAFIPLASPTPTATPIPESTATLTPLPTVTPTIEAVAAINTQANVLVAGHVEPQNSASNVTPPPIRPEQVDSNETVAQPPAAIEFEAPSSPETDTVAENSGRVWTTILNRRRIVLLVVLGILLLPCFYFVQFRLWHNFKQS